MSRPTAVTVIGVIGIVLGAMGLCCGLLSLAAGPLASMAGQSMPQEAQNPQLELLKDPTYARLMMLDSLVRVLLSISLLVGALLLLRMSSLGYNLMIIYSAIAILWTLVSLVLTFTVLLPIQQRVLGGTEIGSAAMTSGLISGLIGTVISLAYPIAALIVLTRPAIKERFTV